MGILLLIISTFLKLALAPFLYLFGTIASLLNHEFNQWNFNLATAKDQYGNGLGKYVFNAVLINKDAKHFFGNIDETISSVIGKNKRDGTLTRTGKIVDAILSAIDHNHSIRAIDDEEQDSTK